VQVLDQVRAPVRVQAQEPESASAQERGQHMPGRPRKSSLAEWCRYSILRLRTQARKQRAQRQSPESTFCSFQFLRVNMMGTCEDFIAISFSSFKSHGPRGRSFVLSESILLIIVCVKPPHTLRCLNYIGESAKHKMLLKNSTLLFMEFCAKPSLVWQRE
jgi:hypothetical protein